MNNTSDRSFPRTGLFRPICALICGISLSGLISRANCEEPKPADLNQALLYFVWSWGGSGSFGHSELHFKKDHTVSFSNNVNSEWTWAIVGPHRVRIQFSQTSPSRLTQIDFDAAFTHYQGYTEDGRNTIEGTRDRLISQTSFAAEQDAEKAISQRPLPQYNNYTSPLLSKPMSAAAQASLAKENARRHEQDQKNRDRQIAVAGNSAFWRSEKEAKKATVLLKQSNIALPPSFLSAKPTPVVDDVASKRNFETNEGLAKYGNAKAMCELGMCLENGKGVGKDPQKAVQWYGKSAVGGDTNGMYNVGRCLEFGIGVEKNLKQAAGWYQRAADGGNAGGMYRVAVFYANGTVVSKDEAKAVEWFRRGAEAGDSQCMCSLGVCFRDGIVISKDMKMATEWFTRAATAGNGLAMNFLGTLYLGGEPKEPEKAAEWFRKGAEAGDIGSTVNLGYCYQKGLGVPRNAGIATQCFLKGAEAGNASAMNNFGVSLVSGLGVKRNYDKGVEWIKRSAAAGYEPANETLRALERDKVGQENLAEKLLFFGVLALAVSGGQFDIGGGNQQSANSAPTKYFLDDEGNIRRSELDKERANREIDENRRLQQKGE